MVYVDGTFRTAPPPYTQFFTIHGELNDHILKLACGLLNNKTTAAYEEVFREVANRIHVVTGQPWVVREMVTDYETAIINAAENTFPGISIYGCYFHFTKAIWRKVQQLGLSVQYRQIADVRNFIRRVMALGFLPINIVRMNWNRYRNSPQTQALGAIQKGRHRGEREGR